MSITTKTGDKGKTALFGGSRVDKHHIRIECNGLIDEANTRMGLLRAHLPENHKWQEGLHRIQRDFMLMMSHIATPLNCDKENKKKHPKEGVDKCEEWVENIKKEMEGEKLAFVLPGGNLISAQCHSVRTGIRNAERLLTRLNEQEAVPDYMLGYFNRLSDLFYMLAVSELKEQNIKPDKFILFPSQKSTNS